VTQISLRPVGPENPCPPVPLGFSIRKDHSDDCDVRAVQRDIDGCPPVLRGSGPVPLCAPHSTRASAESREPLLEVRQQPISESQGHSTRLQRACGLALRLPSSCEVGEQGGGDRGRRPTTARKRVCAPALPSSALTLRSC
jgi:hypothetical protein